MNDYSKMSDFEINKVVAEQLYKDKPSLIVQRDVPSRPAVTVFCDIGDGEIVSIVCADYCNNPADAWPIIVESGIGVAPNKKDPYAWDLSGGMLRGIKHSDANPLRAAMIVFLMMKDAEKC
ncbi:DUF2591 family protein [Serratia marcescens]|uniref:phage protein NinX family protein n=1 Tax=Serratia marcescens TaxID=615 RepID=UPI0027928FC4|nr:phage protein NinX family protein [Serratia marcescens]MDP8797534.1 DUF2591 family protein [Serratia marcescens]